MSEITINCHGTIDKVIAPLGGRSPGHLDWSAVLRLTTNLEPPSREGLGRLGGTVSSENTNA